MGLILAECIGHWKSLNYLQLFCSLFYIIILMLFFILKVIVERYCKTDLPEMEKKK